MGRKGRKAKSKRLHEKQTFSGAIIVAKTRRMWRKTGRLKPRPGAELTVRQLVHGLSFAVKTGFTGGTNHLFPVNTGGFGCAFAHSLADMPQASQWAAVFDQYRFEEIELHLIPVVTDFTTTTTSTNFVDASQFVLDFDDSTALSSENAALEYDNCQTVMPYDEVIVRYKPAVSPAYYSSGAFTGYGVAPSDREWLDAGSANIVHYGVKGWIGSLAATSSLVCGWVGYAQYTVSFKNTH